MTATRSGANRANASLGQLVRHAPVIRLRNPAGDRGLCIRVAAKGHSQPDRMLEVVALEERDDGLRHRALRRHAEVVPGADLLHRAAESNRELSSAWI